MGRSYRVGVMLAVVGCGPSAAHDDTPGSSTSTSSPAGEATSAPGTSATSVADGSSSSSSSTAAASDATGDAASTGSTDTGSVCGPPTCGGNVFDCGDGRDNDDDGLVDLDDPQCTSVCDNAEDSYGQFLPRVEWECVLDCFFDDNNGAGDDMCFADIRDDPLGPGAAWGCPYAEPGPGPPMRPDPWPAPQDPACLDFCQPLTLPGCDCFGCCALDTVAGPMHVLLRYADPDCTPATPEACAPCTSQIEVCGNPCEGCEICFGETAPPAGCANNACENGSPCGDACDCPEGEFCKQGCCWPAPK